MLCPRDGTHLSPVRVDGVILDRCVKCEGLWLDRGELETLMSLDLPEIEEECMEQSAERCRTVEPVGYMRCPRCGRARLQRISYTVMHSVNIDRCEQCLGVWLDKSELDLIMSENNELKQEFSVQRLSRSLKSASWHQKHTSP